MSIEEIVERDKSDYKLVSSAEYSAKRDVKLLLSSLEVRNNEIKALEGLRMSLRDEIIALQTSLEKEEQAHVMSRYDLNMKIAEIDIALKKEKETLNGLKNVYGRGIIEEMKRVKEWAEKIPYAAYNDALREGLDHDDAWGCFVDELTEYIKKLIGEEK